jgi:maltose/moltooligosaccharide transporter
MNTRSAGTLAYTSWGLVTLFFWLLFGEFAIAMRERSAVPSATELLRQYHASDTVISLLIAALPAVISIVVVPVISYRSDRYRSNRGRRIPFLLWQSPLTVLSMIGLGLAPWLGMRIHALLGAASPGLDFCVLTLFALCWTVFETIAIMTLSIYIGLVNDVVPSGLLGRFFSGVRIVSLGAGIIFNTYIFKLTEHHLMEIFIGIGILFGVGTMLMCLKVREGQYAPPQLDAGARPAGFQAATRGYFVEFFSTPYYMYIFAALMFAGIAPTPFTTFSQIYAGNLGISKAELGNLLAASFAVSMVAAFLIGVAVDRFSALTVTTATMALYFASSLFGYFLIESGDHNFYFAYICHVVISGAYYTAVASLPLRLFPKDRFMQFNSAAFLVSHGSAALVSVIQGPVLDYSDHDYKLTLLFGAFFAFIAVLLLMKVRHNLRAILGAPGAAAGAAVAQ